MIKDGTLYWITGLSGAGKTTIGTRLYYEIKKHKKNVILLDGDNLKNLVSDSIDYSLTDRRKRAKKYASLCKMLTDQGQIVICCTIAMFEEVRRWNRENNTYYVEIFVNPPMEVLVNRNKKKLYSDSAVNAVKNVAGIDIDVELPTHMDIELVNDGNETISAMLKKIMDYEAISNKKDDFDRDTGYWNQYYSRNIAPNEPSNFAVWVYEQYMNKKPGYSLLELGCGNGRDSLFFYSKGCMVTAIDASDTAVTFLQEQTKEEKDITFVCDDFVKGTAMYDSQWDYIYSRFSIHAIDKYQQECLLKNVYRALKADALFMIEVRGVHDEIYGLGKCVGEDTYIYEGHMRRFIRIEEIKQELRQCGFEIDYAVEDTGFAPYAGNNPRIIRIVARKL